MQNSLSKSSLPANSVKALLAEAEAALDAHGVTTPRLDAELLLAYILKADRTHLFAHLSSFLTPPEQTAFRHLLERRVRREPLAYITGEREFWSLKFHVTPDVLIPRPETEIIIETIVRLAAQSAIDYSQSSARILEIGAGSGCIAITLAKEFPSAQVWAIDISQAALAVARENAHRHGVEQRIRFLQGDLFSSVNQTDPAFDFVVSNPPYLAHSDLAALPPEVRDWEPRAALNGGRDGLDFYRRLVKESPAYLRPGGWLVMELGAAQWPEVSLLLDTQTRLQERRCIRDYAGFERVAAARSCV